MDPGWQTAAVPLATFTGTVALTAVTLEWLRRHAILDRPGERSSHRVPVPRGAGLALVPIAVVAWCIVAYFVAAPTGTSRVAVAAAALALLSWQDDRRGLPAWLRLLAHLGAAVWGIASMKATSLIFQGLLPLPLDRAVAVLAWVWFTNLYNFMDGLDGMTGTETLCVGGGIALVLSITAAPDDGIALLALVLAAGAAGFLCWNWHPARIFLGDVGSVPLGFLMGFLLLELAARGLWAPALILPLYYLADATLTILHRLRRGERIWEAHRQHYYQRALAPGGNHAEIVRVVLACDVTLVFLAIAAIAAPWPALAGACLVTAATLAVFRRRARR